MTTLFLYALLTTTAFYLLSQAMITKWLWSKYPTWLDTYFSCSACSGFAYGVACAITIGRTYNLDFLGLPATSWFTPVIVGLGAIAWTPLLAYLHINALRKLGGES